MTSLALRSLCLTPNHNRYKSKIENLCVKRARSRITDMRFIAVGAIWDKLKYGVVIQFVHSFLKTLALEDGVVSNVFFTV